MGLLSRHDDHAIGHVELTELSAECEAFLAGTLADVIAHGDVPPVWSWLNAIAHGSCAQVRALVEHDADGDVRATTMATLAEAVIADGRDVGVLQHDVLVPLELAIVGEVMTPRRLIELVGRALFLS